MGCKPQRAAQPQKWGRPLWRVQESESCIVAMKPWKTGSSEGGAVVLMRAKQKENGAMARKGY